MCGVSPSEPLVPKVNAKGDSIWCVADHFVLVVGEWSSTFPCYEPCPAASGWTAEKPTGTKSSWSHCDQQRIMLIFPGN